MTVKEIGDAYGWDLFGFLVISISLLVYFLPTMVAAVRKCASIAAVFLVNLFFGWTLVGWIVAMVLALIMENTYDRDLRRRTQLAILKSVGDPPPNRLRL